MKPEIGDRIRLKIDVMDDYHDIYYSKGTVVNVLKLYPEQKGYEYQIGHGFCIGEEDFEHIPRITEGPYSWVHTAY